MALFWRIWTVAILVNFTVLALFVGLATLRFDSINASLVGERLVVLANRTATPFQAAAKIGLPLSSVRNADALLELARQTDDAIIAIHVFDETGRIVHSTDARTTPLMPPEVLTARGDAAGAPWHVETDAGFISGIDIAARDGGNAGGIVIVYPSRGNVTAVRAMGAELGLAAMGVVLAAAGLSAVLLYTGLRRQIDLFEAIDGAISDFERGAWRSAAAAPPVPPRENNPMGELRQLLDGAEARYRAAGHTVSDTTGEST